MSKRETRGITWTVKDSDSRLRDRLLERARQDLRKGDLRNAARRYKRLTGLEPENPAFHVRLGEVALKMGDRAEAVSALHAAGAIFSREAFDDKAASVYRRAFALDPARADVCRALAATCERQGHGPEALAVLRQGAQALEAAGDLEAALDLRRTATRVDPSDLRERLRLADDLRAAGRGGDALHEYVEAGIALARGRDPARCLRVFDRIEAIACAGDDAAEAELERLYAGVARAFRKLGASA